MQLNIALKIFTCKRGIQMPYLYKFVLLITLLSTVMNAETVKVQFENKLPCAQAKDVLTFIDKHEKEASKPYNIETGYFCWDKKDVKILGKEEIGDNIFHYTYLHLPTNLKIDFYREDGSNPVDVYLFEYDLNGDGEKELFVKLHAAIAFDIEFFLLEKQKDLHYRILNHFYGSVQNDFLLIIQDTISNGYKDIEAYGKSDKGAIWKYDGTVYDIKK